MQKVVQSGLLSKPWQDLLELITPLSPQTRQEVVCGKMTLLQNQMQEEKEAYKTMLDWKTFDLQVQGYSGSGTADALFRLENFVKLNGLLVDAMAKWQIKNIKAAVVHECLHGVDTTRVKAVTPHGEVEFIEPLEGFPGEDLMTKLQLINPPDRQK